MPTVQSPSQSGMLLVNKPEGPTTYDLIRWIKRSVPDLKIGHSGTLDPLAEGLVLLLFGKATKHQDELMGQDKVYRFHVRLGVRTDTGDLEGKIIEESPRPTVPEEKISQVCSESLGTQTQIPPMYSALKYKGKPLYKLARRGQFIERKPRQIHIHSLDFLETRDNGDLVFRTKVSSGTYIRVLAEDLGRMLGVPAVVSFLCRESIGPLSLQNAIAGERLKTMTPSELAAALTEL